MLMSESFMTSPKAKKINMKQISSKGSPLLMDLNGVDTCCGKISRAIHMCDVATVVLAGLKFRKGGQKRADNWLMQHPNMVETFWEKSEGEGEGRDAATSESGWWGVTVATVAVASVLSYMLGRKS